jgi:hypothetical protein
MSCDNSIYFSAIVDGVPCSNPAADRGESPKRGRPGVIADRSKSKGHRHDFQSHTIADPTQIDPECVWGDEGPIND